MLSIILSTFSFFLIHFNLSDYILNVLFSYFLWVIHLDICIKHRMRDENDDDEAWERGNRWNFFSFLFLLIFIELYTHYYSYAYMDPDKIFSFSFSINIYKLEYLQHPFVCRVFSLVWGRIDTTRTWSVKWTLLYGWAAKVWSVWVDGCLSEKIPDVTQDFPFKIKCVYW